MELTDALLSSDPGRMASRAFLVAVLVTLVGPTLVTSWSASWSSLLRWPATRVGGVTLAVGALAGATASTWLRQPMGVVLGVAAGLGLVSLLFDRVPLKPLVLRRAIPLVGALAVVWTGLRLPLTLVRPIDAVLTVALLLALPPSLLRLDRRGRGGVRVVACSGIAVGLLLLALSAGRGEVAAAAAATCGALLALIGGGRSPATGVDGTAASVIGFLLAVATLQVAAGLDGLEGLAAALLLWAVPITSSLVASLARARRGLPWAGGSGGHLIRRLECRGLRPRAASLVVGAVHLVGVVAAVAAGRQWTAVPAALAAGFVPLIALVGFALPGVVHRSEVTGLPGLVRTVLAGVLVGLPLLAAPAAWVLIGSKAEMEHAAALVEGALERIREGDTGEVTPEVSPEGVDPAPTTTAAPAKAEQAATKAAKDAGAAAPVTPAAKAGAEGRCAAPRDPATCLEEAASDFGSVAARLSGPFPALARAVPVLSPNVVAVRTLLAAGHDVAAAGSQLAATVDPAKLTFRNGALPLAELRTLSGQLDVAADTFRAAKDEVDGVDGRFLLGPVRRQVDGLNARLEGTSDEVETIAEAAKLAPTILGGNGARRYLLVVQNNAEARATGGLIANFGVLEADNGRLSVQHFGRLKDLRDNGLPLDQRMLHLPPGSEYLRRYAEFQPESTWQNVNLSPDFPTVAAVMIDLYPQSGGERVDGVLGIDSLGLAALMELSGPVTVGEWPEKITKDNLLRVTLSEAYERFATKAERIDFLADVADTVLAKLAGGGLPSPVRMAKVLGDAARQRHISLFLLPAAERQLLSRLGIDGAVARPVGDSLLVTNQNAGANKVDYYLRRRISYDVALEPGAGAANVDATLDVTLENAAPATGLDAYVIGPNAKDVAAGENLNITSVYGALRLDRATFGGEPVVLGGDDELGHRVYRAFLRVPAASSRTLHMELHGTVALEPGGWYRLDLQRQPMLYPDAMKISISLPDGWKVAEVERLSGRAGEHNNPPAGGRRVVEEFDLDGDQVVRVRLERT